MVIEGPKSALRRAAARALRELSRFGERASTTVSSIKPVVSPWVGRATSRAALLSVQVDPAALRSAFEEYLARAAQTVGIRESWRPSEPEPAERARSPGVLHLSRTVELQLAQLLRLQDFTQAHDPIEAVHQLRVTSRRLRAFVDMFAPFADPPRVRAVRALLRQITRAVRDLRDADVQAHALKERLQRATSESERIAVNHLLDRVRRRQSAFAERAEQRLGKLDMAELAGGLRCMLDQVALRVDAPSGGYQLVAEVAYGPIVDEARALAPGPSEVPAAEDLHRFRLALKQLRYAAEFIAPALGNRFESIRDHAKRLQSVLGEHQDWVEFEKLVAKRHKKAVKSGRETLALGLHGILEGARRQRELCRSRCLEECSRLSGSALFTGLSAAPNALPLPRA